MITEEEAKIEPFEFYLEDMRCIYYYRTKKQIVQDDLIGFWDRYTVAAKKYDKETNVPFKAYLLGSIKFYILHKSRQECKEYKETNHESLDTELQELLEFKVNNYENYIDKKIDEEMLLTRCIEIIKTYRPKRGKGLEAKKCINILKKRVILGYQDKEIAKEYDCTHQNINFQTKQMLKLLKNNLREDVWT